MRRFIILALLLAAADLLPGQTLECGAVAACLQQGPARSYEPDNLFDYMNGNAEGYLVYRFVGMKGVTCKCGEDTYVIDISEMGNPEFAYGIFSANRDQRAAVEPIGMGGQVLPRRATFAKGKYYVEVAASPAKDHTFTLRAYVAAIEKTVDGQVTPPDQIAWFPKDGLVSGSVRLVPESVLGLRMLKSGYVGQYDFGKAFLVADASPEAAAATMVKLKERVGQTTPVAIADEAFSGADKYLDGLCIFRKGRYIGGFANLKGGRDVTAEASRLAANVK
jgi:hypothetical protein